MEWQPIETAPKDRTAVLLYRPRATRNVCIGWWTDDRFAKKPRPYWGTEREKLEGKVATRAHQPTHWMPLPEPPK